MSATRAQVLAHRDELRSLTAALSDARITAAGVLVVHSDAAGYRDVHSYAGRAAELVGVWVTVITDDIPAAQADAEAL